MTLKYQHLLGKPFKFGTDDCYGLVRSFYKDNFNIDLPNYARPNQFWEHGVDLYMSRYKKNNFVSLDCHPSEYRPGDVILCSVQSTVPNHIGVFVDNGDVLHHLWGRPSIVEPYRSLLRNTTVAVFRHRDVDLEQTTQIGNILDYVQPSVRRKLNDYIESNKLPFEQA